MNLCVSVAGFLYLLIVLLIMLLGPWWLTIFCSEHLRLLLFSFYDNHDTTANL